MKKLIIYLLIVFNIFILNVNCNKDDNINKYKLLNLDNEIMLFKTKNVFLIRHVIEFKDKFFLLAKGGLYSIDKVNKKVKKIISEGIGPNEIYKPKKIKHYNNSIWISSYYPSNYLCFYELNDKKLYRKYFGFNRSFVFDDFEFLNDNKLILSNVYWKDSLIKIIDFNAEKELSFLKSKLIKLMYKFNVSESILKKNGNLIYIIESILPEIKVFDLKKNELIKIIYLNHPLYRKIPSKYNIKKYDLSSHKIWMSKWFRISDIFVCKNWLLIKYKRGYEQKFIYELININNILNRYYIRETNINIFSFFINNKKLLIKYFLDNESCIVWNVGEMIIL